MRIKFKAPDPRAGTVAQMDSSRGQFFIDNGSAVKVKDDHSDDAAPAPTAAPAPIAAPVSAPAGKTTAKAKK
jgi:hypothetical protein